MLVKIEARILIFPGTDFHLPSTSVPPGTFLKALLTPAQRGLRRTTAGSNVGDCLVFFSHRIIFSAQCGDRIIVVRCKQVC